MPIENRIGVQPERELNSQDASPIRDNVTAEYDLDPEDPEVSQLLGQIAKLTEGASVKIFVPIFVRKRVEGFRQNHPQT